jgi:hypothetical protein
MQFVQGQKECMAQNPGPLMLYRRAGVNSISGHKAGAGVLQRQGLRDEGNVGIALLA